MRKLARFELGPELLGAGEHFVRIDGAGADTDDAKRRCVTHRAV